VRVGSSASGRPWSHIKNALLALEPQTVMGNLGNQRDEDTVLKRAVRHPRRLQILGFLAGSETGCDESDLAKALNEPPAKLRYHLGVLQSADLVAHVGHGEAARRYAVAILS